MKGWGLRLRKKCGLGLPSCSDSRVVVATGDCRTALGLDWRGRPSPHNHSLTALPTVFNCQANQGPTPYNLLTFGLLPRLFPCKARTGPLVGDRDTQCRPLLMQ